MYLRPVPSYLRDKLEINVDGYQSAKEPPSELEITYGDRRSTAVSGCTCLKDSASAILPIFILGP